MAKWWLTDVEHRRSMLTAAWWLWIFLNILLLKHILILSTNYHGSTNEIMKEIIGRSLDFNMEKKLEGKVALITGQVAELVESLL